MRALRKNGIDKITLIRILDRKTISILTIGEEEIDEKSICRIYASEHITRRYRMSTGKCNVRKHAAKFLEARTRNSYDRHPKSRRCDLKRSNVPRK
jgi:hypothetical protein